MAEEEVVAELEAVKAVYGDDCQILDLYPPHIVVHLKPRTADVSSQQFVEATIRMLAGPKYPEEPPDITVIDSKGLDEDRQKQLIISVCEKAFELAFSLMLVALCEEAVERLSSMNHPDGDCPLCLYSLLDKDAGCNSKPFMKLMSCFHCFHCDCIIKWWNWMQAQNVDEITGSSASVSVKNIDDKQGTCRMMEGKMGNCPVCRKIFHAKDIEHVVLLIESYSHEDSSNEIETSKDVLLSDYETRRRRRYDEILKLQQERNGLIEPKRSEVLLPGMFLPQPVPLQSNNESQNKISALASSGTHSGSCSLSGHNSRKKHSKSNVRSQNSRNQVHRWIRKGSDSR